jgi:hypothetical protein
MGARRIRRLVLGAAVTAILAAGVSACAPGTTDPTPSPRATTEAPSPSPTPTVSAAPAARLLVTAESVSVLTEDGDVLTAYDYRQLTAEVVDGLSVFLGSPSVVPYASTNLHEGDGTRYEWDGFTVGSEDRWAALPDSELPGHTPRWWVRATAPTARNLTVETIDGVRVGDPTGPVLERYPDAVQRTEGSSITSRYDVFLGPVPPPVPKDSADYSPEYRWRVWLFDEDPTDVLEDLRAPSPNYGA